MCDDCNSVLSDSCWLQAAASGDLALFAFDAAATAPRDSLVAALGMMAQAAIVSMAIVSTIAIVSIAIVSVAIVSMAIVSIAIVSTIEIVSRRTIRIVHSWA